MSYDAFFAKATDGRTPFPYQTRLAETSAWPARIEIPTGLGKTLAVVVGWLWRRTQRPAGVPRRLVYCLPMRVLVEQTRDEVQKVVARLGLSTRVVVLMGGVAADDGWDIDPASDAVIIGTQDMLLSRALNRGYGMRSKYRWPLHFGLLNNDCQWIVDEVQLIGSGVATTAQLQAFRRKLGTSVPTHTSWMSATLEESWLRTVDVEDADIEGRVMLEPSDLAHPVVKQRVGAHKAAETASARMGDAKGLAGEILGAHRAATRTLAIVNTVERARELFLALRHQKPDAELVLLHSRFRPAERQLALARALATPGPTGTVVVSTQVIEAGVDISSATMFTEVAPWASLVQRFGRCNRKGEDADARVFWIGLPVDDKARKKVALPYEADALEAAEAVLVACKDVGPGALPRQALTLETGLVLRRRDLLDLFDTTPDLMGNDVDVSRFIRDSDDHDLRVCWRDLEAEPPADAPSPGRDELCSVPIGVAREWQKAKRLMWRWDGLRRRWVLADRVHPGLTLLLRACDGGYDQSVGLEPKGTRPVSPIPVVVAVLEEGDGDDPLSEWRSWYLLRNHSEDVAHEAGALASAVGLTDDIKTLLTTAGRWHDAGKAHHVWQDAARRLGTEPPSEPVAKTQRIKGRISYQRRGFRHELVSALMALSRGEPDLVCYLVASHHGKVRLSIRSLPAEKPPLDRHGRTDATIRHARGAWEGDVVPAVDLGGGLMVPETTLTLSYMVLGDDEVTGPSWSARMLALRDDPRLGPFRLGYLEALLKCADERASRAVQEQQGDA